jgi:hypothetical protein
MAKFDIPQGDILPILMLVMAYRGELDVEFPASASEPIYKKRPELN